MIIYYLKQFGLYYAGTEADGTIRFANSRARAFALRSMDAAIRKSKDIGGDVEIEERTL